MSQSSSQQAGLVALFYQKIPEPRQDRAVQDCFQAWFERWELVHGRLERKRPVDRAALARRWPAINSPIDLPRLLFAIETCCLFRLRLALHQAAAPLDRAGSDKDLSAGLRSLYAPPPGSPLAWVGLEGCEPLLWFLDHVDADLEEALRGEMAAERARAGPFTGDAARAQYLSLVPKAVRHALGEYYTPNWLAQMMLEMNGYSASTPGFWSLDVLDPTCGTGVFLVAALLELARAAALGQLSPTQAVCAALDHLAGIEINPFAAHAARVNFALWLLDMHARGANLPGGEVRLPIICGDCLFPSHPREFDLVIGNPPWMNWEYLPPEYRERLAPLWAQFGLYALKGLEQANRKEDLSTLVFAASARLYLREGGRISFVMPQAVFQSSLNARGLRASVFGEQVGVRQVDDLVKIRPFEGTANRPAVIHAVKGERTAYPVRYRVWAPARGAHESGARARIYGAQTWEEARGGVEIEELSARPVEAGSLALPWVIHPPGIEEALARLSGPCPYRARSGVFTGGANAVYTLELLEPYTDGTARVRNITERARRQVLAVEAVVESALLYPLLRGREVSPWRCAPRVSILCPHTEAGRMAPIPPEALRASYPLAAAYLARFEGALRERKGFTGWEKAFFERAYYAIQRVGGYTFAPYKVVWRYIAPSFTCAVAGPAPHGGEMKPVFPNEKLMLIGLEDPDEAYYLCGLLSSSPVRGAIESRMVETQVAPHVIERLALPRYDSSNAAHRSLSDLCREGHRRARAAGSAVSPEDRLALDALVGGVLPISPREIAAFQDVLLKKQKQTNEPGSRQ